MKHIDRLADLLADRLTGRLPYAVNRAESQTGAIPMQGVYKRTRSWCVDTTVSGRRIRRGGFPSRAAAEEWLWAQQQIRAPLVKHAVEAYMKGRGAAVKSADRYRQLGAHLERHLGDFPSGMIRQADVDDYQRKRLEEKASPKTIFNELAFLRTVLRYAWKNDKVPDLPRFTLHRPRCERARVAGLEEIQRILEVASLDLRRVILAAWSCGMRRGEIISARWDQINLSRGELLLEREQTKTGRARRVAIPRELLEELQCWPRHEQWVWCRVRQGRNGRGASEVVQWEKTALHTSWIAACTAANVSDLRFHDLRRSFASLAQERGHSLDAVRQAGGWEDPGVLERHYSHASSGAIAAVGSDLLGLVGDSVAPKRPLLRLVKG